jgi:serine protease AprX
MRLYVLLWACTLLLSLGVANAQPQHGFRITFSDKKGSKDFTNPLALLSQRALDRRFAQGIVLDSLDLPVSPVYVDSILKVTGGKMHLTSRWFNQCVILLYDSSKILTLQNQSFIKSIEYVAFYAGGLHKRAEDENEKFRSEWPAPSSSQNKGTGSEGFYGSTWGQTDVVNGDYLHDRGYFGQGKLIAVCDEGFQFVDTNPGFDSLRSSGRLVDQYNFVKASTNVFQQGTHGTGALSTMAGYLPGVYVGAAPLAQYALYSTEYPTEQPIEMDNFLAAMERADSIGADVITGSIGYNEFDLPKTYSFAYEEFNGHTTMLAKGANIATSKGILFVASAGNEGQGPWRYILTPGDADSAITVGSVDINQNIAGNSGYGPNAAGRVKPDVCMVGQPASILNYNAETIMPNLALPPEHHSLHLNWPVGRHASGRLQVKPILTVSAMQLSRVHLYTAIRMSIMAMVFRILAGLWNYSR